MINHRRSANLDDEAFQIDENDESANDKATNGLNAKEECDSSSIDDYFINKN